MKYGYFDDKNREYVINNPRTPWPWINYLGNEDFFSLISNSAGGYTFYKDAKFRRITGTGTTMCQWTAVAGISILMMEGISGLRDGSPARLNLTAMNAAMA